MNGNIKYYNEAKGYGFILAETGENVFFHISVVASTDKLFRGQAVEFDYKQTEKGLSATYVKICEVYEEKPDFVNIGGKNYKLSNIKSFRLDYDYIFKDGSNVFLFEKPYYLSLQDMSIIKPVTSYETYSDQPILTVETYQGDCDQFYKINDPESICLTYEYLCDLLS